MNIDAVKQALRTLVVNNTSTLVTGLSHQGVARTIEHVTTSLMTPPTGYYYVSINVTDVREASKIRQLANANMPPRTAVYDVTIHVADYAVMKVGDAELYTTDQTYFDDLVDRISKLISDQTWIGTSPRFRLVRSETEGRVIERSNALQPWFDELEQFHAMLVSQLRFQLAEEQTNDSLLY